MKIESFKWAIDANNDGSISPDELWHTLQWLYELPGNLMVEALGHVPVVAETFHIHASAQAGYYSLNSWFTAVFSLFFWLFVLVELAKLKDIVKQRLAARPAGRKARRSRHKTHFPA